MPPLAAGSDRRLRLVVTTTDPASRPGHSSWYLLTNLPRPATRRTQQADLAEVVRLYGLRNWVEQGDKQVKGELGWADLAYSQNTNTPSGMERTWVALSRDPEALPASRRHGSGPGPGRPARRPAQAPAPPGADEACLAAAGPTRPARRR